MPPDAIRAEGLTKTFKKTRALRGVDLRVRAGTVTGLLGRNGAGKTTALRILTTLLLPDSGRAEVAGFDVVAHPQRVRARIGVTGQSATMDELLTGRQNLETIGRLFHLPAALARRRADELLERFEMTDAAGRLVKTYSGGMRRRLDLAASLVAEPPVLFLDEPTTGLDPVSRGAVWRAVRALTRDVGTSVLLTTQYLEEADQLADEVTVIDHGMVVATGPPGQLKASAGQSRVRIRLRDGSAAADAVQGLLGPDAEHDGRDLSVPAPDGMASLAAVITRLAPVAAEVDDIGLARPTLDEVFTELTGGEDPARTKQANQAGQADQAGQAVPPSLAGAR
ncbi:MAG TPA: ATP-binding cassette domain-containing protein [Streptosporangiaceae bacterium]